MHNIQMGPMTMQSRGPCPECSGQGFKIVEQCNVCSGKGKQSEIKELNVRIQPGTPSGETIVFSEACSEVEEFERPGDIHFILEQADTEGWKRIGANGQHLETSITLSLPDSLVGCHVVLNNHPGYIDSPEPLTVEIPPGTFQGDVYCLSGLGMPIRGDATRYGDLYIRVQVTIRPDDRRIIASACNDYLKGVFTEKGRYNTPSTENDSVKRGLYLARIP